MTRLLTAVLLLLALMLTTGSAVAVTEHALNTITGQWVDDTQTEVSMDTVVSARWNFNVNPPQGTASTADQIVFTVLGGEFVDLPEVCGPASSLEPQQLVCAFEEQTDGNAANVIVTVRATGGPGEQLTMHAEYQQQNVELEPLQIIQDFNLDLRVGSTGNVYPVSSNQREANFVWSLRHGAKNEPGADPLTFRFTVDSSVTSNITFGTDACAPFTQGRAAGHPWSKANPGAANETQFVQDCSITALGGGQFEMQLTGIDYSQQHVPTQDSAGRALPVHTPVIASGQITVTLHTAALSGNVQVNFAPVTYTAPGSGATAADDTTNNTAQNQWATGNFFAGFAPGYTGSTEPFISPNYRVPKTKEVRARSSLHLSNLSNISNLKSAGLCVILDGQYMDFTRAEIELVSSGRIVHDWNLEYYVSSSPLADPNAEGFCAADSARWVSNPQSAPGSVQAVRVKFPITQELWSENVILHVNSTIKPSVTAGQDIWTWGSGGISTSQTVTNWTDFNRSMQASDVPSQGFVVQGKRYPYLAPGRDMLIVTAAEPQVAVTVNPQTASPGDDVEYQVTYQAVSGTGENDPVHGFAVTETLPAGTEFTGQASVAPDSVTWQADRQVLSWTFDDLSPNQDYELTYQVRVTDSAQAGGLLRNSVTAVLDGVTSGPVSATLSLANSGWTRLAKTAAAQFIPNTNGQGTGSGTWTIRVKSEDPVTQEFTDTIDVLPHLQDGRGSQFHGTYKLSTPVNVPAGVDVYYTNMNPAELSSDPADPMHGALADTSGNAVGWTREFTPDATAVRMISGPLAPGANLTYDISVTTAGSRGGDVYVNEAQTRAENTRELMRSQDTLTTATYYAAELHKEVQDRDGQWRAADDPADFPNFRIGDTVRYRISLTNQGEGTLQDITVVDSEFTAGNWHVPELEPGETVTHEYQVTLDETFAGPLLNTASATLTQPSDSPTPVTIAPDSAGINVINYQVGKTVDRLPTPGDQDPRAVTSGDELRYTIEISQQGSEPATAFVRDSLIDVLDDADLVAAVTASTGSVNLQGDTFEWTGTLQPGEVAQISYTVRVHDAANRGNHVLHNVAYSPGCGDAPGGVESGPPGREVCETVTPVTDIEFTKTANPADGTSITAGQAIDYTVTVTNTGATDLADLEITDTITDHDGVELDTDTVQISMGGKLDVTANQIHWVGNLPAGEQLILTYAVQTLQTVPAGGVVENTLDVQTSDLPAQNPIVTEHPIAQLVHNKVSDVPAGQTIYPGLIVTYTLTATNVSTVPIEITELADTILSGAEYVKLLGNPRVTSDLNQPPVNPPSEVDLDVPGHLLTWQGTLQAGETITISYQLEILETETTDPLHNELTTLGRVAGGTPTTPDNQIKPTPVSVFHELEPMQLSVDKQVVQMPRPLADERDTFALYEITVTNTSSTRAGEYSLTDSLHNVAGALTPVSMEVQGPEEVQTQAGWLGERWNGITVTRVAQDITIEANAQHVYQVKVWYLVESDELTTDQLSCGNQWPDQSSGGITNTAEIIFQGKAETASACMPMTIVNVQKTITDIEQISATHWRLHYAISVHNPGILAAAYTLTDTVTLPDSANHILESGTSRVAPDDALLRTDGVLPAQATHGYAVQLDVEVPRHVYGIVAATCAADGQQGAIATVENTATVLGEVMASSDSACAQFLDAAGDPVTDLPAAGGTDAPPHLADSGADVGELLLVMVILVGLGGVAVVRVRRGE